MVFKNNSVNKAGQLGSSAWVKLVWTKKRGNNTLNCFLGFKLTLI